MAFDPQDVATPGAKIKVIGVGGGGTNAVSTMIRSNIEGVDFVAANTDVQSLRYALAPAKIQIGKELTKGLGAGADPDVGRDAALEDRHQLQEAISGSDMVFITAGMGGGTGTGGASVVSQIARDCGALTVGVVTKPFNFEGKRRRKHAEIGIARLREQVDTLIVIPNDRLLKIATPDLTMLEAFKMADNVLVNAVRGISDIINVPGTINVDFADVKTVMSSMGQALMGIGNARGEKRAIEAAKQAISSPLLEDVDIEGATGILINITAGSNISLMEINEACSIIQEAAHEDANIIFGAVIDEAMADEIRVTVIATGFPSETELDYKAEDRVISKPKYKAPRHTSSFMKPFHEARPEPRDDSFNQILNEQRARAAREEALAKSREAEAAKAMAAAPVAPVAPAPKPYNDMAAHLGAEASQLNAEDLTRWTMEGIDNEPHVEDSIAKEATSRCEPSISFEAPAPATTTYSDMPLASAAEQNLNARSMPVTSPYANTRPAESSDFDFAGRFNDDEPVASEPPPAHFAALDSDDSDADASSNAAAADFDSFFLDGSSDGLNDEIDKKIDEALELAERVKKVNTDDDELDVPAFLRNSSKDLSLS